MSWMLAAVRSASTAGSVLPPCHAGSLVTASMMSCARCGAANQRRRQAGERHSAFMKVRIGLAPDEGVMQPIDVP